MRQEVSASFAGRMAIACSGTGQPPLQGVVVANRWPQMKVVVWRMHIFFPFLSFVCGLIVEI